MGPRIGSVLLVASGPDLPGYGKFTGNMYGAWWNFNATPTIWIQMYFIYPNPTLGIQTGTCSLSWHM